MIHHGTGISSGSVHTILHQHLQLRKLCARSLISSILSRRRTELNGARKCLENSTMSTVEMYLRLLLGMKNGFITMIQKPSSRDASSVKLVRVPQQKSEDLSIQRNRCMSFSLIHRVLKL